MNKYRGDDNMSNSPLVVHTKLSPNCSKPRKSKIDTISIHCVAGNMTIESLGDWLAKPTTQASSNYGVGTDGRIGLYVNEADRSWCTSSPENDNRAITIEVANNGGSPDWPVSDKALASLIELLTDVCKRNGIPKLVWRNDKNNPGNMTVHRWFRPKECPGNYLMSKHGYIADEVNKRLGGFTEVVELPKPVETPSSGSPEEVIWDFLRWKGLNPFAIAGLMGNLFAESGLKSNILENIYKKSLNMTDESYTKGVDTGTYTNFVRDKAGYGLAQWTFWSRKEGLLNYAKEMKTSIGDLTMQLNFLWKELQGYTNLMKVLKSATSVREASDVVLLDFERPADQSEAVKVKRTTFGHQYFSKFSGKTPQPPAPLDSTFKEYQVRVTANELNFRKGPGTNHNVTGTIRDKGVYTITEEATGTGAKKWGKLKSGVGWISLDFTTRV